MPGMAPPNGGPDHILRVATTALHVVNEVSTAPEARAAVQKMAAQKIPALKIWVDDRRGTYPKMTPEVYNAIIDEAHKHQMIVHAHATTLPDQKAVVRAGADVLVHLVQGEKLDDEYLALLKEKKPYWATVIGLGDPTGVCENDPFFEVALPPKVVAAIRATVERRPLEPSCGPPSPTRRAEESSPTFSTDDRVGPRIVLAPIPDPPGPPSFGRTRRALAGGQLGLTPSEALARHAAAGRIMGLKEWARCAASAPTSWPRREPLGTSATRRIASVYLDGRKRESRGDAREVEEAGRVAVKVVASQTPENTKTTIRRSTFRRSCLS